MNVQRASSNSYISPLLKKLDKNDFHTVVAGLAMVAIGYAIQQNFGSLAATAYVGIHVITLFVQMTSNQRAQRIYRRVISEEQTG